MHPRFRAAKSINSAYTISQPVPIPGSDTLAPRVRTKLAKERTSSEPKSSSSEQEELALQASRLKSISAINKTQASLGSTSFVTKHLDECLFRRAKMKALKIKEQLGYTTSKPIPIPTSPLARSTSATTTRSTNAITPSIATFTVGRFMNSPERQPLSPEFLAKVNGTEVRVRNKSKPLIVSSGYEADDELSPSPSLSPSPRKW